MDLGPGWDHRLIDRRFCDKTNIRVGGILPREPVTITDDLTIPRDGLWLASSIIIAMVRLGDRLSQRGAVGTWRLPAVPAPRVTPMTVLVPVGLAVIGLLAFGPLWRGAIMTTTIAW